MALTVLEVVPKLMVNHQLLRQTSIPLLQAPVLDLEAEQAKLAKEAEDSSPREQVDLVQVLVLVHQVLMATALPMLEVLARALAQVLSATGSTQRLEVAQVVAPPLLPLLEGTPHLLDLVLAMVLDSQVEDSFPKQLVELVPLLVLGALVQLATVATPKAAARVLDQVKEVRTMELPQLVQPEVVVVLHHLLPRDKARQLIVLAQEPELVREFQECLEEETSVVLKVQVLAKVQAQVP
jgi:hypothetical protein